MIEASEYTVREFIAPRLWRAGHQNAKRVLAHLHEGYRQCAKAGSADGGHWTPFRNTCQAVARYVVEHPGCTLKELIDKVDTHYNSSATARACLAKWIGRGVVAGVRARLEGRQLHLYPGEASNAESAESG